MDRFDIPVLLICFNRPESTRKVLERIAEIKPSKFFVVMDGPRSGREDDVRNCQAVREMVTNPSWECELITDFSPVNLGCKVRVSSGISWVFNQVESAIILEDDCLPHPTFFGFCRQMLEEYRDDERVMQISGNNFQNPKEQKHEGYYFSVFNHIWGWATWRRAWKFYDVSLGDWPALKTTDFLKEILGTSIQIRNWTYLFDEVRKGRIDTWDYQWTFTCWAQRGLTILPECNLVTNIGFDGAATHTLDPNSPLAGLEAFPIRLPVQKMRHMIRDVRKDLHTERTVFHPGAGARFRRSVKSALGFFQIVFGKRGHLEN